MEEKRVYKYRGSILGKQWLPCIILKNGVKKPTDSECLFCIDNHLFDRYKLFKDTYRYLYPDKENVYTWWSYMRKAREKNVGWRIDYFIVSNDIKNKIKEAKIDEDVMGSDHCPVELEIEI